MLCYNYRPKYDQKFTHLHRLNQQKPLQNNTLNLQNYLGVEVKKQKPCGGLERA